MNHPVEYWSVGRWRFRKIHAPSSWRRSVRRSEIWLTFLAAFIGMLGGCCVVAITRFTLFAHAVLYGLDNGGRLSGLVSLPLWRCVLVLGGGGAVLGVFGSVIRHFSARNPVDPIEANALHGGRMSVRDSLVLVCQTLLSNGAGASVGLEAGFTQISAALGSRLGQAFRVRREDLRVLVGAGAAGAIGAAFDAPVAGAFYAFELVIGTYSLTNLCPVAAAAVSGMVVVHLFGGMQAALFLAEKWHMGWRESLSVGGLSILCALSAILVMYCVTLTESLFRRLPVPGWMRPLLGGVLVGSVAAFSPSVLSAGHAGMTQVLLGGVAPAAALVLFVCKAATSCLSIGSGFRGGLFFASLYLGALAGEGFGVLLAPSGLAPASLTACEMIGMSAMAVAIIGGPMTVICMIMEMTHNVSQTGSIVLAAVLSLLTVRRLFGYSFATWRFHLRGEAIRSAVDVAWKRNLIVQSLMRQCPCLLSESLSVREARQRFPLGSGQRLVLVDDEGGYAGMVSIVELHATESGAGDGTVEDEGTDRPLSFLARWQQHILLPGMDIQEALDAFACAEADILVVVEDRVSRQVVGQLAEQYALRRYATELERCRRELAGEHDLPAVKGIKSR